VRHTSRASAAESCAVRPFDRSHKGTQIPGRLEEIAGRGQCNRTKRITFKRNRRINPWKPHTSGSFVVLPRRVVRSATNTANMAAKNGREEGRNGGVGHKDSADESRYATCGDYNLERILGGLATGQVILGCHLFRRT